MKKQEHVLRVQMATQDKLLISREANEVIVPAAGGYIGILPGHTPFISPLSKGVVRVIAGGKDEHVSVQSGLVEVSDNRIIILVEKT